MRQLSTETEKSGAGSLIHIYPSYGGIARNIQNILEVAHIAVVDVQHGLQAFAGIINRAVLKVDRNILLARTSIGIDIDDLTGRVKRAGVKGHGR